MSYHRVGALFFLQNTILATLVWAQSPSSDSLRFNLAEKVATDEAKIAKPMIGSGELAARLAEYAAFVIANPANPIGISNLGSLYTTAGRYEDAVATLKIAPELEPRNSITQFNLSVAYQGLGNVEEATRLAQRVVSSVSENIVARKHLCGLLLSSQTNFDAVGCYEILLKSTPDDLINKSSYGLALMKAGQMDRAAAVFYEINVAHPGYAGAYNGLGLVRHQKKQFIAAQTAFKTAVEIEPNEGVYRYNLAVLQIACKNKIGAISQYNFLKTSDPGLAGKLYKLLYADKLLFVSVH